ncbi:ImmA/IrrE family metallo-endopeptidase [Pseudoalteromonas sp. Angola-7]|uniref:ImmA/IrrE family metallo-endopeptidase n=1 Tax=Pseudoalteromonas sp. Angola-7 TaxID=3025336 RepID=UPI0023583FAE|nr:ImmA/IrrE family metallo-endopeptidase [Pseudoalteromonas sp. Angola-7]MDC9529175.1 ImmA/IrrE family metallo-endopeptidase [Pseudoalteromonas sp. Angola-7]
MASSAEWNRLTAAQRSTIQSFQLNTPVAIGKVAQSFGIVVKKATLEGNLAGEIKETDGIVTIRVNSHDVKARQRYTIAHEIAHYLLHRHLLKDGIQDTPLYRSHLSSTIEREADSLAADILMPDHIVQNLLSNHSQDYKNEKLYEIVAESLGVSKTALKIKLGVA